MRSRKGEKHYFKHPRLHAWRISKGRKGMKFSKTHIKNLSKALINRKLSKEHKKHIRLHHACLSGINHPMYGKK